MSKLAFVFPGQGSQKVGMGAALLETDPELFDRCLAMADEASGLPIRKLCLEGPTEELTRTDATQPALFAVGIALDELARELGISPACVAGHSLGEYTAAVASGALGVEEGMRLVSERGRRMADIQEERPGAMAAILGLPVEALSDLCEQASEAGVVSLANLNTPTQTVVSGEEAGVVRVMELSEEAGAAKAIRLQVGGAFHSELMKPVQSALAETMEGLSWSDPAVPLVANHSGELATTADDVRAALVAQIASPVRWVDCTQTLADEGCDTALELGPGRVLGGLIRKISPEIETLTADSREALEAVPAAVAQAPEHRASGRRAAALAVGAALLTATAAAAVPPPRLSQDASRVAIDSTSGSGAFGRWRTDAFGLPAYRYTLDQTRSPIARQPEIQNRTDAWHQLGNEHAIALASNDGFTQLWSQDRRYQWANRYHAEAAQYGGGFGYLRSGNAVISTLYPDRPRGAPNVRDFGVGYARRRVRSGSLSVDERTYAPLGSGPVLVHEVTIRNTGSRTRAGSWFEYWGANPYDQAKRRSIGLASPRYRAADRTISVAQLPDEEDRRPLTLFAASLSAPPREFTTDSASFFGAGTRARPAAVVEGRLDGSLAAPVAPGSTGRTMIAFRAPWRLRPGRRVTLRYAYGIAAPARIGAMVLREGKRRNGFARNARAWARWVPQVRLGAGRAWLSRELQWAAYSLRSGTSREDCRGHRIISQGGYYQYELGFQGAFRDPLQHILPMIYASPGIARDVLLYSASQQPRGGGQIPYAMSSLCRPNDALEDANDMDLWLLWAAAEYGLATRDTRVFDRRVRFADAGAASLWSHLRSAFRHQESLLGPHGGYLTPGAGDWSDFSTLFLQMTESQLVSAQLAYVYPRVAQLAELRGDRPFARQLRAAGARNLAVTRREWTGRGWYSRGYAGDRQIGRGAIFGEPQPWAILAGAPRGRQADALVGNIRRFLTGIGAPASAGGPARIGSSQSPAASDPLVTERSSPVTTATGDNNAVFVGGSWYAVNGWLTWALGSLADRVPRARDYAFDELQRNTLRAHARAYPGHWGGTISVDDACRAHFSTEPSRCGIGITKEFTGGNMHQPAWGLFDTIRLAGVEPTTRGYRVLPTLPLRRFSLRLPRLGLAWAPGRARGYVVTRQTARLTMEVRAPSRGRHAVYVDGRRVRAARRGRFVVFRMPARAGRPADWAVVRIALLNAGR